MIIERFAREQLRAGAQSAGLVAKSRPEVLFVCERNAGPSQMAAALAHHVSNGWVSVRSAGAHPDEQIDPVVVQAMGELGIDVSPEFPKPLTDEVLRAADVVVTLGCGDACAVYPGRRYVGQSRIRRGNRWRSCARFATSSFTTCASCSRASNRMKRDQPILSTRSRS